MAPTVHSRVKSLFTEHPWVYARRSRVKSLFTERPWVYAMAPAVLVRRAFRVDSLFTAHPGAKEVTALTPTTCSCLQSVLGFCGTLQVPG